MFFIVLLALSAMAIAGSAAFFSVYGLAATFSGTFWSVVIMGGSLEAGKLVAASYLYRYWNKTSKILKGYLMLGVLCLMLLTSTGIYGYLASGYQTDVLPLKQVAEQVSLLENEKVRKLERKKQIDDQIAKLPDNSVRGRERLIKQFKDEQAQLSVRANELDQQLLALKQQQIKTEAHIGPITYIAKAFGLGTDDATKYLIFLIIFAFDPMAVALTLAVNIALKNREEEKKQVKLPVETVPTVAPLMADYAEPQPDPVPIQLGDSVDEQVAIEETTVEEPIVVDPIVEQSDNSTNTQLSVGEQQDAKVIPAAKPAGPIHDRFMHLNWTPDQTQDKLRQLVNYYKHLKDKLSQNGSLTPDETHEKNTIESIFRRHGYDLYI